MEKNNILKKQKEEFNLLLKKAGLTKKDFSNISSVSYNTVKMWGHDREVPNWVKPFIENYIKAKTLDNVKDVICPDNPTDK